MSCAAQELRNDHHVSVYFDRSLSALLSPSLFKSAITLSAGLFNDSITSRFKKGRCNSVVDFGMDYHGTCRRK